MEEETPRLTGKRFRSLAHGEQIRVFPPCSWVYKHVHGEECLRIYLRDLPGLRPHLPDEWGYSYEVDQTEDGNWTVFYRYLFEPRGVQVFEISPVPDRELLWIQLAQLFLQERWPGIRVVDWDGTRLLVEKYVPYLDA